MASSTASLAPAAALLERLGLRVAPTDAAADDHHQTVPGLLPLCCAVQHYEWGRRGADSLVARLAGEGDGGEGRPCAELWMGTHPAAPSSLGRDVTARWGGDLPFLFKVCPVASPLPPPFPSSRAPS